MDDDSELVIDDFQEVSDDDEKSFPAALVSDISQRLRTSSGVAVAILIGAACMVFIVLPTIIGLVQCRSRARRGDQKQLNKQRPSHLNMGAERNEAWGFELSPYRYDRQNIQWAMCDRQFDQRINMYGTIGMLLCLW